jgi:hypothetical protein
MSANRTISLVFIFDGIEQGKFLKETTGSWSGILWTIFLSFGVYLVVGTLVVLKCVVEELEIVYSAIYLVIAMYLTWLVSGRINETIGFIIARRKKTRKKEVFRE